jgi:hypothetical protein
LTSGIKYTDHNRNFKKGNNVNWTAIINGPLTEDINQYEQRFGKSSTLRGSYYRLLAQQYFENTKTSYGNFIDATSIARWRYFVHHENGGTVDFNLMPKEYLDSKHRRRQLKQILYKKGAMLPFDCFADDTRITSINFPEHHISPYGYNNTAIEHLKDAPENYAKRCIPRWLYQPRLVEIWTEKYTMVDTIKNILLNASKGINLQVRVVPDRGFASNIVFRDAHQRFSWFMDSTHFYSTRLKQITNHDYYNEKKIYIFYIGDFDPSGDSMDSDIQGRLARMGWGTNYKTGIGNLEFKRIAVTKDIIHTYNLPYNPDRLTKKKLDKDSRTTKFKEKNDDILYAVEVDSFAAIYYDAFANLILQDVNRQFNEDIYNEHVLPIIKRAPDDVTEDRDKRIKFLDD